MRRGYVDTPEGQLHYLAEGKGEPLVLLHQGPRSSRMYVNLIPLLSKDYSVIAIDMIWYGGSDLLPPEGADVTYVSQNVVHVFDAFGLERTHLFGLHTGAAMAAEVAARATTMVATLCLFGFPYMISVEERDEPPGQEKQWWIAIWIIEYVPRWYPSGQDMDASIQWNRKDVAAYGQRTLGKALSESR